MTRIQWTNSIKWEALAGIMKVFIILSQQNLFGIKRSLLAKKGNPLLSKGFVFSIAQGNEFEEQFILLQGIGRPVLFIVDLPQIEMRQRLVRIALSWRREQGLGVKLLGLPQVARHGRLGPQLSQRV